MSYCDTAIVSYQVSEGKGQYVISAFGLTQELLDEVMLTGEEVASGDLCTMLDNLPENDWKTQHFIFQNGKNLFSRVDKDIDAWTMDIESRTSRTVRGTKEHILSELELHFENHVQTHGLEWR